MIKNPLTPLIPLTNGINNSVINRFVKYLNTKTGITSAFGSSIFSYDRFDIASIALPAIVVYPRAAKVKSSSYYFTGALKVDIIFPTNLVRMNKLQSALNVGDFLYLQIKQDCVSFMSQQQSPTDIGVVYGMRNFGFDATFNFDKLYDAFANQSMISLEFSYDIDMTAYEQSLLAMGMDLSSPDVAIYNAIQNINIDLPSPT